MQTKFPNLKLKILFLIIVLSGIFGLRAKVSAVTCIAGNCYVETNISTVDGTTFCDGGACTSANTIIIRAGARGGLLFQNFNGNGSYITIKNELKSPSTRVIITNNNGPGWGVLNLRNCKYVDLRGDNDPALITTERSKGIIINAVRAGDKAGILWVYGISDHLKVSYIEANHLNNPDSEGVGIQLQDYTLDGAYSFTDMEFHHIWLHDINAQGAYFGPNDPYGREPWNYGTGTRTHLRRISIHDNIVEDAGCEGWDIKGCDAGPNEFYNNKIIRSGAQTWTGGKWDQYLNYGDMSCGLKVAWTTHEAVVNVHDNYFESTAGPSINITGSYSHEDLTALDGDKGGRIYVYDNIVTNAGTQGGPIPFLGNITRPAYQSGILSWYRTYQCDVHDNIVIQPNKYGLAVGGDYDVMTALRNLTGDAGVSEHFVATYGSYKPGIGVDANTYYTDVASVGFTAWSDDNNYANDIFTFSASDATPPAVPTGLRVE